MPKKKIVPRRRRKDAPKKTRRREIGALERVALQRSRVAGSIDRHLSSGLHDTSNLRPPRQNFEMSMKERKGRVVPRNVHLEHARRKSTLLKKFA